ncbi:MAG: DUF2064 domain-containing protein [Thermoanaerobaculia bacterium]
MQDAPPIRRPPTLLVFTLGPAPERRRRRLLPPAYGDREEALYRACLDEALAAGRSAGCRLAVSSPGPLRLPADVRPRLQAGQGFGPRLADAFDAAGPAPEAPVVVVGTDTPGLSPERVTRALELLRGSGRGGGSPERVIVGPSPDGGLYLLAAGRPLGPVLRRVPWRRRNTLGHLRRTLAEAGFQVLLLDPLADLDRPADLEGWLHHRAAGAAEALRHLAFVLRRLLAGLRLPSLAAPAARPRPVPVSIPRGRAPPRLPSA